MKHYEKQDFSRSLVIFTDGSSLGNPGPGGYGAVLIFPQLDEVIELGGGKPKTTNNEMELSAVIAALSHTVFSSAPAHIFTDSSYVIKGITQWVFGWEKNGWKTQAKEPVANQELWKTLLGLVRDRQRSAPITWNHVPGHVGVPGNERCDAIAVSFASGNPEKLFRGRFSDYGKPLLDFTIDTALAEKKAEKKQGTNAKAYSYLSLVDGILERHTTWPACESRVKGKKARFKKALSADHEQEILKDWGVSL